ncbi:hypothetical protein ALP8811_00001 [Aliiroseovarius pelagivivens]|uniref:Uncharacterized protein n=1 Tax=Aliiroseovarius pelagivivens TaxID=1639690 RepID=A0A2R8AGL1_9RHOB|nr:hypothetical protein ALP8811_00001 [Aliiroseovarius pelagivivens]
MHCINDNLDNPTVSLAGSGYELFYLWCFNDISKPSNAKRRQLFATGVLYLSHRFERIRYLVLY